jgi:hypothetical protein
MLALRREKSDIPLVIPCSLIQRLAESLGSHLSRGEQDKKLDWKLSIAYPSGLS